MRLKRHGISSSSIGRQPKPQDHHRRRQNNNNKPGRRNNPVQEFCPNNFALDRKIKEACIGLKPADERLFLELRDEDKELIANYIIDWSDQYGQGLMMSPSTNRGYTSHP